MQEFLRKIKELLSKLFGGNNKAVQSTQRIDNTSAYKGGTIINKVSGNNNTITNNNTINNGQKISVDKESETINIEDFNK